jgi:hypothetical protein
MVLLLAPPVALSVLPMPRKPWLLPGQVLGAKM